MAHHAVHLVAIVAIAAGLFGAAWGFERRPARAGAVPNTPSRDAWERSLFGLGIQPAAAVAREQRARRQLRVADVAGGAAALSFLAGAIHIAALGEHLGESLLFGVFFLMSGAFQIATGFALRARPSRVILTAIVAVNAAIVGLWVLSRTAGVPAGPRPWVPERVGPLDAAATACEIALIVAAVLVRRDRDRTG